MGFDDFGTGFDWDGDGKITENDVMLDYMMFEEFDVTHPDPPRPRKKTSSIESQTQELTKELYAANLITLGSMSVYIQNAIDRSKKDCGKDGRTVVCEMIYAVSYLSLCDLSFPTGREKTAAFDHMTKYLRQFNDSVEAKNNFSENKKETKKYYSQLLDNNFELIFRNVDYASGKNDEFMVDFYNYLKTVEILAINNNKISFVKTPCEILIERFNSFFKKVSDNSDDPDAASKVNGFLLKTYKNLCEKEKAPFKKNVTDSLFGFLTLSVIPVAFIVTSFFGLSEMDGLSVLFFLVLPLVFIIYLAFVFFKDALSDKYNLDLIQKECKRLTVSPEKESKKKKSK